MWLGDGTSAAAHYTSADPEIAAYIEAEGLVVERTSVDRAVRAAAADARPVRARPCPMCGELFVPKTSQVQTCGKTCGGKLRAARRRRALGDVPRLRRPLGRPGAVPGLPGRPRHRHRPAASLGVLGDKHIPAAYLRASVAQRRALLAGLLDTDGTVAPSGVVQFAVTSRGWPRTSGS